MDPWDRQAILAEHDIEYRVQPGSIRDALPFGNGRFGGLVYRPGPWEWVVGKLDVDIDDHKDYRRDKDPGLFMTRQVTAEESPAFRDIMKAVAAKDGARLDALQDSMAQARRRRATIHTVGPRTRNNQLNVMPGAIRVFSNRKSATELFERLNLYEGRIEAACREGNACYDIETVCDTDADVFSIRFKPGAGVLPLSAVSLVRPPHDYLAATSPRFGVDGDCLWVEYAFENHFRYAVAVRVKGASFRTVRSDGEIKALLRRCPDSGELTLTVSCATCLECDDPRQAVLAAARAADHKAIRERASACWADFWAESAVRLDDDFLENLYYVQQYAFACAHGRGMKAAYKAAGLYGAWPHTDHIVWMNRNYGDVNIEMAYQHLFASNHLSLFEPFVKMVEAFMPVGRTYARSMFHLPGACLEPPLHCMGLWYCLLLWQYYRYSGDERWLRDRAYPILKEFGAFYARFLRKNRMGRYELFGTLPPETGVGYNVPGHVKAFGQYCLNTTIDLVFLKSLFRGLVEAAHQLKTDAALVPRWREILAHFPMYPTAMTPHGTTIVNCDEFGSALTYYHPNTLAPVYPAKELHFSSPRRQADLVRRTVHWGWDKILYYYTFSAAWASSAMARLGEGDEALRILNTQVVDFYTDPSGAMGREIGRFYTPMGDLALGPRPGNPPLHEVGCGLIATINEMLVQEQGGVLFLFPALPSAWHRAAFERLRIPGAFLVSAEYTDDRVRRVEIHAERGGSLRLRNPWPNALVRVTSSSGTGTRAGRHGRIIRLRFAPGETAVLVSPSAQARPWPPRPASKPKSRRSLQGYRLFLGHDAASRIAETVETFCFPALIGYYGRRMLFEKPNDRKIEELAQNVCFKFDFGAGRPGDYDQFFARAERGDPPFTPIAPRSVYNNARRYGWAYSAGMRTVRCGGGDPLSRTAIEGRAPADFRMRLDAGFYSVLLLHGSEAGGETWVAVPELDARFRFSGDGETPRTDGFGICVPADGIVTLRFGAAPGRRWRVHGLLVKRAW